MDTLVDTQKDNIKDSDIVYFDLTVRRSLATSTGIELTLPNGVVGIIFVYDSIDSALNDGCDVNDLHVALKEQ